MQHGCAHVGIVPAVTEDQRGDAVDGQADAGDHQHGARLYRGGGAEPADGLMHDERAREHEDHAVDECREDLGTTKSVRMGARTRPLRDALRDDGQGERATVAQHVARIGHQRERARP